jgi:D-amino-acid oxidase
MKSGISLTTVSINPQLYLPYLQSKAIDLGATFLRQRISHINEAFTLDRSVKAVVNATGLLARLLPGVEDEAVYPIRGQTILVRNTCSGMYARVEDKHIPEDESTYIIPRPAGGGTILGGSRQKNNWLVTLFQFDY